MVDGSLALLLILNGLFTGVVVVGCTLRSAPLDWDVTSTATETASKLLCVRKGHGGLRPCGVCRPSDNDGGRTETRAPTLGTSIRNTGYDSVLGPPILLRTINFAYLTCVRRVFIACLCVFRNDGGGGFRHCITCVDEPSWRSFTELFGLVRQRDLDDPWDVSRRSLDPDGVGGDELEGRYGQT